MHVSVAIVGYNNCEDILRCLKALENSSHSDFDVVICENGGGRAFRELSEEISDRLAGGQYVQIINAPNNPGYAGGVNLCFQTNPAADAWWILNPDTCPHSNTMAALAQTLVEGKYNAVGGVVYLPNGRIQCYGGIWQGWFARAVSIGYGAEVFNPINRAEIERTQNYLSGASMMVTRQFVERVGPLREDYFLYGEEVEWCIRAASRGMRLAFCPDAYVLHFCGTTTGSSVALNSRGRLPVYLAERNQMLLTRDIFPKRLPIVALTAFVILIFRSVRERAWKQLGYGLEGWIEGLLNKRGQPAWNKGDTSAIRGQPS